MESQPKQMGQSVGGNTDMDSSHCVVELLLNYETYIGIVKVIIAGGRSFDNYDLLCQKADKILSRQNEVEIVSGAAKGADKLGEKYGDERGYPITRFPADWGTFGNSAGYRRNVEMAVYADALIAFWNTKSNGTKHMIDIARNQDLLVRVITY